VRYVTHQFAHPETLDRARRWLIQAGIDPRRIEVHPYGTPRLAVAVKPGESAEVALLIDAAEAGDPDGFPSFLELARSRHIYPEVIPPPQDSVAKQARPASFVIAWRPIDTHSEGAQTTTDAELLRAYREHWGDNF
jgi:hypothetical protein